MTSQVRNVSLPLTGRKVALRPIEERDIGTLWQFLHGEEAPEWKKWDAPYFEHKHVPLDEYREKMTKYLESSGHPYSRLLIEVDKRIIGMVTFYWENQDTRWLEMGIVIYSSEHWSGGFGTEALSLYADYLFMALPEIARVGITTWSGNERMMRCALKLGMQLEGRMRKCRFYNGVYYDSIRMGILREEWEEHHGQGHDVQTTGA